MELLLQIEKVKVYLADTQHDGVRGIAVMTRLILNLSAIKKTEHVNKF
jgi:hypothetical protein